MKKQRVEELREHKMKICAAKHQGTTKCNQCRVKYKCFTEIKLTPKELEALVPVVLCNVPNTAEGNAFYRQFNKYLNKERYTLRRYGRGKNRKANGGTRSWIPLEKAEYFGVYLRRKTWY
jgi:hypothetical protein